MMDVPEYSITIPPKVAPGGYSNAFRVVSTEDGVCVLDFVRYLGSSSEAVLVSRVRVRPGFLPEIRDKLDKAARGFPHVHFQG